MLFAGQWDEISAHLRFHPAAARCRGGGANGLSVALLAQSRHSRAGHQLGFGVRGSGFGVRDFAIIRDYLLPK